MSTLANEASALAIPSEWPELELTAVRVEREAETLRVVFTITNTSASIFRWGDQLTAYTSGDLATPSGVMVIDPAAGTASTPTRPAPESLCVCSKMQPLAGGERDEYFASFADMPAVDFVVSIPTFPVLLVRDDVVQRPTDVPAVGVAPVEVSTRDGNHFLDAAVAHRIGDWTLVEVQISAVAEASLGYNEMRLDEASAVDPATGATFKPVEPASGSPVRCICSRPGLPRRSSRTASRFVFFDRVDAATIDLDLPEFGAVIGVPVIDA